jgi:enamine deaminase RidA (YjgF/YER057c/UK114 family)
MVLRSAVIALCAIFLIASTVALGQRRSKKKEKEEVTQVLEIPKDPPGAVVGDVSRLVFHVSPLSSKGLLSQQVKDGLKALQRQTRRAQIVRIRAFVAGSGDLRRVPAIVSEEFTDRRIPLPAVTMVQVGALPLAGAQVQLESISVDRNPSMPHGAAFISGQVGTAAAAAEPLTKAVASAGLKNDSVRKITCFLNALEHVNSVRSQIAAAFPKVPVSYAQVRRDSTGDFTECEAVAALNAKPSSPEYIGALEGRYTQVVKLPPGPVAITGIQLAFGREIADARLAFERLERTLEGVGASAKSVVMTGIYPLTRNASQTIREVRREFFDTSKPPASTLLLFEGLSSLDAFFGIDAIAVSGSPGQ